MFVLSVCKKKNSADFYYNFFNFFINNTVNIITSKNTQKNSINLPIKKIIKYFYKESYLCKSMSIYTYDIVIDYYLNSISKEDNIKLEINSNNHNSDCIFLIKSFSDRGYNKN